MTDSKQLRRHLAVLALLAAPAAAQNLATNGGFDGSITGWPGFGNAGTLVFSTLDANGSPSSGSLQLTNSNTGTGTASQFAQCVSVQGGVKYTLSGKIFVPSGQFFTTTNRNSLSVLFYSQPGCTGAILNGDPKDAAKELDVWHPVTLTITADPTARSAQIGGFVQKIDAGGSRKAHFDDLVFVASGLKTLTIASSASIHGVNNAFFHTDVWVSNRSFRNAQTVTATYRCQGAFNCSGTPKTLSLLPRETRLLEDVVSGFFLQPETAGAIEGSYDAALGEISVTSRTYTPSLPSPTFGTSIPASDATAATARALFLGLGNNGGNRSSGFRSNAGAYSTVAATVSFRLFAANGQQLGSTVVREAQPNQPFQINDIFNEAGAGSTVTTNATLVVSATAPVFPFVTVIDNQSGDSVWTLPTPDEAP